MKQHLQHFEDNVGAIYRYICKVALRWRNILWQCQCCTCELVRVDTPGWSNTCMLAHRLHENITSLARHWPQRVRPTQGRFAHFTLRSQPWANGQQNVFHSADIGRQTLPPPPTAECVYIYFALGFRKNGRRSSPQSPVAYGKERGPPLCTLNDGWGGANTKHQFACLKFGLGKVVGVTYSWFAFLPYQFSLW